MRTDILFNTAVSDIELGGLVSPFSVLGRFVKTQDEKDLYEVDLSQYEFDKDKLMTGIYVVLPIMYSFRDMMINVKYRYGFSDIIYETGFKQAINPSGSVLKSADMQRYLSDIDNSDKISIMVSVNDENIVVYNGETIDLQTNESMFQNRDLLLNASEGNLYNAQLIGVGLIDFLNSDLSNMELVKKVIENFNIDGMSVISMQINNDTGYIVLQTKENKQ